ncbi:hypothetical protein Q7P36_010484 [Cladosporium allicinum]
MGKEQPDRDLNTVRMAEEIRTQNIGDVNAGPNSQSFVGNAGGNVIFSNTVDPKVARDKAIADCRSVLFLTDPEVDRATLITAKGTRVPGTCEWIRKEHSYQQWLEGNIPLLWICGGPGKGKTMLSVFLVDELEEKQPVISYFCTNEDERRNNASAVLRSLLWQITRLHPDLAQHFLTLLGVGETDAAGRTEAALSSVETLWMAFTTICRDPRVARLAFILDGLDECDPESRDWLASKIRGLVTGLDVQNNHPPKIIIVSRGISCLEVCSKLRLDPDHDGKIGEDVQRFVSARVQGLWTSHGFDENLRQHVRSTLLERSEGSFLWVGFAIAELLKKQTVLEIEQCLDDLPVGLTAFYGRMLRQITARDTEKIAKLLQWTTMSARPLSLTELAAAIPCKATRFCSAEEVVRDLVTSCQPFLAISSKAITELENNSSHDKLERPKIDEEQTVTLVHQSARDFLNQPEMPANFRFRSEEVHFEIAWRCMNLIQVGADAGKTNIMLEYAMEHWPAHARKASQLARPLLDHPSGFFGGSSRVQRWWWQQKRARGFLWDSPHYDDPLHLSAYIGFIPWVETLLAPGWWFKSKVDHVDRLLHKTPLQHAARRGHGAVMRMLLEHSAMANSYGYGIRQLPAIHIFAESGNEMAVRICIDHGFALTGAGTEQQTPLHLAAAEGHDALVKLLLGAGADCEAKDIHGRTALMWAAFRGYGVVVRSLLDHGAVVESRDHDEKTAWGLAVARGHKHVARILPEGLWLAASRGDEVDVRLHLDSGVPVDAKNDTGMTALCCAALGGHSDVVQILIDRGADITTITKVPNNFGLFGGTIMHFMNFKFKEDERFGRVVQLCCNAGADINAKDFLRCTALHLAVRDWDIKQTASQLQMLVDHGANVNAKDRFGATPLHYALDQRDWNRAGISFLLDHGAQTNAIDNQGRTPLHRNVWRTLDPDLMQQLLDHGADINACDNLGLTPLDHAIRASSSHTIEILTRLGAVEGRRPGAHLADCKILPTSNLDTLETRTE